MSLPSQLDASYVEGPYLSHHHFHRWKVSKPSHPVATALGWVHLCSFLTHMEDEEGAKKAGRGIPNTTGRLD